MAKKAFSSTKGHLRKIKSTRGIKIVSVKSHRSNLTKKK